MNNPLVTVYIPTYNRIELLKRAIQSVRNQTYTNLEIIIVDDCSTDGTQEYLKQVSQEDKRIRYFLKEKNSGACVSRNIAIDNATGEYITGLDDDDYFLESRIYDFISHKYLLDKYVFICSIYCYLLKNNEIKKRFSEILKPFVIEQKDLLSINYVNNQIFTKTCRLREKKFLENMPAWQDLYTWYSLLEDNKKAYILKKYSYVVDISHEYERITLQKKDKIQKAYDLFIQGHCLNDRQSLILKNQLIMYGIESSNIYYKWSIINSLNMYTIYSLVVKVLNKIIVYLKLI